MQEKEQKISPIKQRILSFADTLGISKREFYTLINVSRGTLESKTGITEDVVNKFIKAFPDINTEWLIKGIGTPKRTIKENTKHFATDVTKSESGVGIPLIPIEAMAGLFAGSQTVMLSECERYIVPSFRNADFLIAVRGDSMQPHYFSGDLVACKMLSLADIFFQWGKVYVIDTEQGALIKKIEQGSTPESILLVSANPAYKPFEISRSSIYHIAIVQGVIREE